MNVPGQAVHTPRVRAGRADAPESHLAPDHGWLLAAPALTVAESAVGPLDNRFHVVACQRVIQIRNGARPRLGPEGRLAMAERHSTRCSCQGCWSRGLIRDATPADERYSEDELEDFGHLLKEKGASQGHD